ncbi:hypothetical protein TNCV_2124731 [Trichonephila clavipes]|uniref:Uncharacterized protein n=1 Tax=Trichonephila clavipes TaxID=2585209 RepID=A0A8X6UP89_TRICX|nr:hypothetical protein TNCV_2124731 [Trichonephila clavipes]
MTVESWKRFLWPDHTVFEKDEDEDQKIDRWIDCPEKDLKTINVRNRKSQVKNRTTWNGILRNAKAKSWESETATAGSDVAQSGRPIFDDFFQHLWSYIGNNTANVVFQMVKRLWLIRIDE